jgi:uncharacterized protein YkuJ
MKALRSNLRLRVLLPTAILALGGMGVGAFAFTATPGGSGEPLSPSNRPATGEAAPATPAARVSRARWAKQANAVCARLNRDANELGTPQSREELLATLPQALALADAALAELRALPAPQRDRARVARMLNFFGRFAAREREAVKALEAGDTADFARRTAQAFAVNDRGNRIARALGADQCAEGGTDDTELARELERHGVVVAVLYAPDSVVDRLAIREARAGADLADAGFVAIDVYDAKEIAPVAAQYAVRGAPSVFVFTRPAGAVTQFAGWVDRETVAQAVGNAVA